MLKKPEKCKGCVFYGDGNGWVGDELRDGAEVLVYGQNPGADEEEQGKPFVGKTGQILEKFYLPQAGLERESISLGNAIRCRWNHQNNLPPIKQVIIQTALKHCHDAYFKLPTSTKLVVAMGEYALFALTQHGGKNDALVNWRGYLLPMEPIGTTRTLHTTCFTPGSGDGLVPVLATYHVAYTFRDPIASFLTRLDWRKVKAILAQTWPSPLPKITLGPPPVWPKLAAFDTEFVYPAKKLIRYSLFDGKTLRVVESKDAIQCIVPETAQDLTLLEVWKAENSQRENRDMQAMLSDGLSGLADSAVTNPSLRTWPEETRVQAVPQSDPSSPGMAKALASNRVDGGNLRADGDPSIEPMLDLSTAKPTGTGSLPQNRAGSWTTLLIVQPGHWVIVGRSGFMPSSGKIPLTVIFHNVGADLDFLARMLPVGTLINFECTMNAHACLWSDFPHGLGFLGSLYGSINRWKHLVEVNPIYYAAADAFVTWEARLALNKELDRDKGSRAIYEIQRALVPIILVAEARGIKVDPIESKRLYLERQAKVDKLRKRGQAIAGWPINMKSNDQVANHLFKVENLLEVVSK